MDKRLRAASCAALLMLVALSLRPGRKMLCDGFLPPNTMNIPVGDVRAKGIEQAAFNEVLDGIQKVYGPIVASKGAKLQINRLWTNGTVNASAQQQGSTWIINMYGGLARHQAVTKDGFALVACHEMGHHLGGFPKYDGTDWASNEGESDYFANLKCLRKVLSAAAPAAVDPIAKAGCSDAYAEGADRNRCMSGTMAGASVSALLAELGGSPKPELATPDTSVVDQTSDSHPAAQCRLDTYYSGSLCTKSVNEDVSNTSPTPGACTAAQGFKQGLRPLCWYKPGAGEAPQFNTDVAAMPDAKAVEAKMEALKSALLGRGI